MQLTQSVRRAALENKNLDENLLVLAVQTSSDPEFLTEVATTPRWSIFEPVRRAIVEHASAPESVKHVFERTAGLLQRLPRSRGGRKPLCGLQCGTSPFAAIRYMKQSVQLIAL